MHTKVEGGGCPPSLRGVPLLKGGGNDLIAGKGGKLALIALKGGGVIDLKIRSERCFVS